MISNDHGILPELGLFLHKLAQTSENLSFKIKHIEQARVPLSSRLNFLFWRLY